ncbi:MAG: DUF6576 domain-containing protein, partial [Planctomycetota bacterium]
AIAFGIAALVSREILLLALAFFGYLTCWRQRQMLKMGAYAEENEFGYDFSQGYTSLEKTSRPKRRPGLFARRRLARAARREQREKEKLERHRQQVDAILQKISDHGASSLTEEERRILEVETQRQRSQDH